MRKSGSAYGFGWLEDSASATADFFFSHCSMRKSGAASGFGPASRTFDTIFAMLFSLPGAA
jgi:hypothetical protein